MQYTIIQNNKKYKKKKKEGYATSKIIKKNGKEKYIIY